MTHSSRSSTARPALVATLVAVALALSAVLTGADTQASVRSIAGSSRATETAQRADLPQAPRRPQVYLAYTGAEYLLGNTDDQWSYVRANLDGLWGNVARVDVAEAIALTRKVATRDLVIERDIAPGGACRAFTGPTIDYFELVEALAPDIRFDRKAAALYAGANPNCWGASGGIFTAIRQYRERGYPDVYALYQPQNTSRAVNAGEFPTFSPGSSGDDAYRYSGGVVLECPVDACVDPTFGAPFWNALSQAHARNAPFIWYTANSRLYGINGGWLQRVARTYQAAAAFGLWRPEDKIVIVHNDTAGAYPMLPERQPNGDAADTTTGILYWLLQQTPISTLCTRDIAC